MQPMAQTSSAGTAYTATQVLAAMRSPASERWVFDLLDSHGAYLSDATQYIMTNDPGPAPVITHDATQAVRRSITFTARGDWAPAWLSNLIRPRYRLLMPDGGYVQWVLGTFTMALPERIVTPARTYLNVKGYDLSQILAKAAFATSFAAPTGANCVATIQSVIATVTGWSLSSQIPDNGSRLSTSMSWQAGDSLLSAVNAVLEAMTYQSIAADEMGVLRSVPFPNYNQVVPAFTFDTTSNGGGSLVASPLRSTVDISQAINACRVIVENPKAGPGFAADYQNDNPASAVSVGNWGGLVVLKVVKDSKIVDATAAYARAQLEVQRGSWVYAELPVGTAVWPLSQDLDVYRLIYTTTDEGTVDANYLELGWTHTCKAGAITQHRWRRLVAA